MIKGGHKVGSNLCGFLFGYGIRRTLFTGIKGRALSCVKTLVTKIIVAGLILVIKDVALLKYDASPFAGCYCHSWEVF